MTAWYREAFSREYLSLYPHRGEDEARRDVEQILRLADPPREQPLLDLCCGAGRHLIAFWDAGFRDLTGLDLSQDLLEEAERKLRERAIRGVRLLRADMRSIPEDRSFFTIVSLFTSFGYFADEAEDLQVLRSVRRTLRPSGIFLMDTLNREHVLATLVPRTEIVRGERRIQIERRIMEHGRRVEKTTRIADPDGDDREYLESVRMYGRSEMGQLFLDAGFLSVSFFGGLDGRPFHEQSPRMVVCARRET